jgi:hypothetical protein
MFGLSIFSHFCCSGDGDAEPSRNRYRHTSTQNVSVMMMLIMKVAMTIRTGRCAAPHSAAWFTRVAATRLAQSHASPQVARELPHFLWQGHRLIEIGQELTKDISSCHLLCIPRHFFSIVSLSHVLAIAPAKTLKREFVFNCDCLTRSQPCTINV